MFSEVAKQDGGRQRQKRSFGGSALFAGVDNYLPASICHYTQLDISNTATAASNEQQHWPSTLRICIVIYFAGQKHSKLSPFLTLSEDPFRLFSELEPRAISRFKMVGEQTGGSEAVRGRYHPSPRIMLALRGEYPSGSMTLALGSNTTLHMY